MTARFRRLCRFVPAFAIAFAACGPTANTPPDTGSVVSVEPGVVISTDQVNDTTGDKYTIMGRAFVQGNVLHVTVQYGGGCRTHEFRLHASHVFLESNPVQSPLAIRHDAHNDLCKALLTHQLRFDLTALRDAWRASYRQQSGTIILRLRGYSEGIAYVF
jgi:hypothetical protein